MTKKKSNCSVLLCVYYGNDAENLKTAIDSITIEQTAPPEELVIVVDGPINENLNNILVGVKNNYPGTKIVYLAENHGVGYASNQGLKVCNKSLVAKMDADDIAEPNRLELQCREFQNNPDLVLLGGQLAEFDDTTGEVVSIREVPIDEDKIKKFARRRSPFNNQTVMYKKQFIDKLGGYPSFNRSEDYYLYAKVISAGYQVKNLDKVLTKFRLDRDAIKRRRTWHNTKENIIARNNLRKLGVSSSLDFIIMSIVYIFLFILPTPLVSLIYRGLRKKCQK